MIPREAGRGSSFQGAGLYYLHDKDALTSHRVAFVHCENLPTQDPRKALGWMAWTHHIAPDLKRQAGIAATGRKGTERPVYTVSLAWHPEEKPTQEQMIAEGRAWLKAQGLHEHQVMMVSHKERDHPHLHMIVNLVHPTTGKVARLAHSRLKSSRYAEEFEKANGKVYCQQRVENNRKRAEGKFARHKEEELRQKTYVTQLYHAADNGRAFSAALKEMGLTLAQSKRIVLVDRDGKVFSLYRQLDGVKAAEAKAKLADLRLPTVEQVQKEKTARREKAPKLREAAKVFDREGQDRDWQEKVIDASIAADRKKAEERKAQAEARQERTEIRQRIPAKIIDALSARQEQDRNNFREESEKRREALAEKLRQQYGPQEERLNNDIAALGQRRKAEGVKQLLRKVSGREKQDEEALAGKRKSLDNLQWWKIEAVQTLENKLIRQRRGMESLHRVEWRNLDKAAAQQEARGGRANYIELKDMLDADQAAREQRRERSRHPGRHF